MSTIFYDDGNHRCIKCNDLTEGGEIQSNQFLIIHNCRGLLIDCGGYRIYQNLLGALSRHLPAGSHDYIFLSLQDPDIGSGLNLACHKWAEMVRPLDVEMVVPQHGARISGKDLVGTFYDSVASEKTAVDFFADSLYQLPAGAVKESL